MATFDIVDILKTGTETVVTGEQFDKANTDKSVGKITYLKDVKTAEILFAEFRKEKFKGAETDWSQKVTEYNSPEVAIMSLQLPTEEKKFKEQKAKYTPQIEEIKKVNPDSKIIKKLEYQEGLAEFFFKKPVVSKTAMAHIPAILARNVSIENKIMAGNLITVYGSWLKNPNAPRSFSPKLMWVVLMQLREGLARMTSYKDMFDSRGAILPGFNFAKDNMECGFTFDEAKDKISLTRTAGDLKDYHYVRATVSIELTNYRKSFLKIDPAKMTPDQKKVHDLFALLWKHVLQSGWDSIKKARYDGVVIAKAEHGQDVAQVKMVRTEYPKVYNAVKPDGPRANTADWVKYAERRRMEAIIMHYYMKRFATLNRATTNDRADNHAMKSVDIAI